VVCLLHTPRISLLWPRPLPAPCWAPLDSSLCIPARGFEGRVILTSTAAPLGTMERPTAPIGATRPSDILLGVRDGAHRSSVEELHCRREILSAEAVLLCSDPPPAWTRFSAPSPSSSDLSGASRLTPASRAFVGQNGHIGRDIASRRNRDYYELKQATEDLRSLTQMVTCQLSGVSDQDRKKVKIGCCGVTRTRSC
jgi:hypothetical protein